MRSLLGFVVPALLIAGLGVLALLLLGLLTLFIESGFSLSGAGLGPELRVATYVATVGVALLLGALVAFLTLLAVEALPDRLVLRALVCTLGLVAAASVVHASRLVVLKTRYGSLLAYYAATGDLPGLREELADEPTAEALARALGRAARKGNTGALPLLLAAGADFQTAGSGELRTECLLSNRRVGLEFVEIALAHGVTPATCANSEALIWFKVSSGRQDAPTAEMVRRLRAAGWSPDSRPDGADESSAQLADARGFAATLAALR